MPKYKSITRATAKKWFLTSNVFAQSLISPTTALKEYNTLTKQQRIEIKQLFSKYDDIRRKKIPSGEADSAWLISVMVDSHIIATEYSINPLTAVMCLTPPCSPAENIFIK